VTRTALCFVITSLFLVCPVVAQTGETPPTAPAPPPATPEPEYPIIRVGVLSYLQYDAELNRDNFNAFDVTRAYLNVNGQLAENVRFRFTPDIRRLNDSNLAGSLVLRVKYAFLEYDNFKIAKSWVRFGAHQTPWLDFEESIDRYRVQGPMFSEREGVIPGSSDLGLGYFTPLGKYAEVQTGVYNGEGYALAEANKYKSLQGRLTVRPFADRGLLNGFRLSGFYSASRFARNRPRNVGIVMGSYQAQHVVTTLQYVTATERPLALAPREFDRGGPSGFVEIRQGLSGWALLARLDSFDPDRSIPDTSQVRTIAGGAYWVQWQRSRFALVVTNEQVHYDAGSARPQENRLLVQTLIEF